MKWVERSGLWSWAGIGVLAGLIGMGVFVLVLWGVNALWDIAP